MGSPRRGPDNLTASQEAQILALAKAGATSPDTGKGPYDRLSMCNPLVIGALRDMGLAASRVVRRGRGSQFTAYWLTDLGRARAAALRAAT